MKALPSLARLRAPVSTSTLLWVLGGFDFELARAISPAFLGEKMDENSEFERDLWMGREEMGGFNRAIRMLCKFLVGFGGGYGGKVRMFCVFHVEVSRHFLRLYRD